MPSTAQSIWHEAVLGSDTVPSCILQLLGAGIPPGSSVHGILQAGILEWVAIPFSRESSWTRNRPQVSCIAGGLFTIWATREAPVATLYSLFQKSYQSNCQGSYECPRFSEIRRLRQARLLWEGAAAQPKDMLAIHGFKCPPPWERPVGSADFPVPTGMEELCLCVHTEWSSGRDMQTKTANPVAAAYPGWDWHVWYRLAWHDFRRAGASLYGGWQMHWSRQMDRLEQTLGKHSSQLCSAWVWAPHWPHPSPPAPALSFTHSTLLLLDPTGCQTLSSPPLLPWKHWFAHFISEKSALTSELSPAWHMSNLCYNDYPCKFCLTFWLEPYAFCCHVWLVITSLYLTCRRCSINACWGTHLDGYSCTISLPAMDSGCTIEAAEWGRGAQIL